MPWSSGQRLIYSDHEQDIAIRLYRGEGKYDWDTETRHIRWLYLERARSVIKDLGILEIDAINNPSEAPSSLPRKEDKPLSSEELRKAREREYGPPQINMQALGMMWTAILKLHFCMELENFSEMPPIPGRIAALMMSCVKQLRIAHPVGQSNEDSYLDAHAYLNIAKELKE